MSSQQLKKFKTKPQYFPTHPAAQHSLNKTQTQIINNFIHCYHNSTWIAFQDNIQYEDHEQYLKRYYRMGEFKTKIKLMGDYYRYHFEVPRNFMAGVARILEVNVEEKREIELAIVTKEMRKREHEQDDEDDFPIINTGRIIEDHEKIIKDVELSYDDFQEKPINRHQARGSKGQQDCHLGESVRIQDQKVTRTMNRVDSIKFKGSFLVFKPKNQAPKLEQPDRNKPQPKYKKPKNDRKQKAKKIENNCKKDQTCKTKQTSKLISNNNSIASQQGLSRSKSRTQLTLVQSKNFGKQLENMNQRSNNPSLQSSLTKSLNKKEVLGDRKGVNNAIPRKYSKIDLGPEAKNQINKTKKSQNKKSGQYDSENQNQKTVKAPQCVSRKKSQTNIDPGTKKMFNKALQIKKKK